MSAERTEAPTPRRIREARRRGEVSKSQEVVSIGVLLMAVLALRLTGPALWANMSGLLRDGLMTNVHGDLTVDAAGQLGRDALRRTALLLGPLLGVAVASAVALNVGQTGLLLSTERLKPRLDHLNPLQGVRRILSPDGLVQLAKALLKMGVVAFVVTYTIRGQLHQIAALATVGVAEATVLTFRLAFDIALRAALVLFVLSVADYAWQRRKHMKQLRMTRQELKQELKESEGDPHVRAAQRRRRESLLNRMIAAVPTADVVVTNPVHVAVALKYDAATMHAPVVVAKGERLVAQRIKQVARDAGVPVLEEPPLARALFSSTNVGQPIPVNLYHAVAEVLAWVYSLRETAAHWGRAARRWR